MSYGNWKHILGVFNFQNSIFNGIFVIKLTSWDPWSEQHHTQALLLMGLLQRLFTKADHTLKSHLHLLGFLQRLLMSCNFFLFLFPFLFIGFLGFSYPSSFLSFHVGFWVCLQFFSFFFYFFSFLFTRFLSLGSPFFFLLLFFPFHVGFWVWLQFFFSFLSFSRWFSGLVFVPTDYKHQTHSKITSTKPKYPQIDTKQSYGLSRICCFSSPFLPSTLLCQSQTHRRHCCVIVFFNKVFSDKCLWSFCSIFLFLFSFTHFFSHLHLWLNG